MVPTLEQQMEKDQAASRAAQLKRQNEIDKDNLRELKQMYKAAEFIRDMEDMAHARAQMKVVKERIDRRNKIIKTLVNPSNPAT